MLVIRLNHKEITIGESTFYLQEFKFGCDNDCYRVIACVYGCGFMDEYTIVRRMVNIYDIYERYGSVVIVIPENVDFRKNLHESAAETPSGSYNTDYGYNIIIEQK